MTPPPSGSSTTGGDAAEIRRGTAYGFLAYGIWGAFPIYFAALAPAGAWEILAHRILWTLVVCALALAVLRDGLTVAEIGGGCSVSDLTALIAGGGRQ